MSQVTEWKPIINDLVGKSFGINQRGPDAFDCWGLVLEVYKRLGHPIDVDWIWEEEASLRDVTRIMEGQTEIPEWERLEHFVVPCVVALSTHRRIHHVGVMTPFGVLHSEHRFGVILTERPDLKYMGYQRVEFYRWVG